MTQIENYKLTSLMNTDAKRLKKVLVNRIQHHGRNKHTITKWDLFQEERENGGEEE